MACARRTAEKSTRNLDGAAGSEFSRTTNPRASCWRRSKTDGRHDTDAAARDLAADAALGAGTAGAGWNPGPARQRQSGLEQRRDVRARRAVRQFRVLESIHAAGDRA